MHIYEQNGYISGCFQPIKARMDRFPVDQNQTHRRLHPPLRILRPNRILQVNAKAKVPMKALTAKENSLSTTGHAKDEVSSCHTFPPLPSSHTMHFIKL